MRIVGTSQAGTTGNMVVLIQPELQQGRPIKCGRMINNSTKETDYDEIVVLGRKESGHRYDVLSQICNGNVPPLENIPQTTINISSARLANEGEETFYSTIDNESGFW